MSESEAVAAIMARLKEEPDISVADLEAFLYDVIRDACDDYYFQMTAD